MSGPVDDAGVTPDGLETQGMKRRLESLMFGETDVDAPSVGRFTILGRLGQGGMGTVFSAYDPDLDRKVALKLLRGGAARSDPERSARLLREAQTLARLSHPNVVSIHEVGTVGDEVFMALEYVAGGSLDDTGEAEQATLLEWLVQAGRGVAAAHERGLVHRDIKPGNVLLTEDGRAKVSDFGLATDPGKAELDVTLDGVPAPTPSLAAHLERAGALQTETGAVLGTPAFMAPEQIDGSAIDARSDQFSFCVMAFRVLEGRPPFVGQTIMALREAIAAGPSSAKAMPAWLESLVARGLAENPAERHPSMQALLDAIDRGRRPRDWKLPVLGLGALGTLGITWVVWGDREPVDPCASFDDALADVWNPQAQSRGADAFAATEQPFADSAWRRTQAGVDAWVERWGGAAKASCEQTFHAGAQSDEAHDLRIGCLARARVELEALVDVLADADTDLVGRADALIVSLPDIDRCARVEELRAVGLRPESPEVERAEQQVARARSAIAAGRMDHANEAALVAVQAADASGWAPVRAEARLALGKTEQELGELQRAEELLREAIDIAESNRVDHILAEAWTELLSNVADFQSRPESLDRIARRAESSVRRIADPPMMRIRYLTTLGRAKEVAGDYPGARKTLEAAMALVEATESVPPSVRIITTHQLAQIVSIMGEAERAIELRTAALDLAIETLGAQHPTVAKLTSSLAVDYMEVPDNERALALFDEAIALREAIGIPAAPPFGNRGQLLVNMGRPREALPDFERAIELFTAKVGPDHPTNGVFLLQKATAYLSLGDLDAATSILKEADALLAKHLPPDHPHRLAAAINLASVLSDRGKADEALTRILSARASLAEVTTPCAQPLMSTTEIAARAQLQLGHHAAALQEYAAMVECWDQRPPDAVDVVPSVNWGRAKALRGLGREDEARALAEKALATYRGLGANYIAEVEAVSEWLGSAQR